MKTVSRLTIFETILDDPKRMMVLLMDN